MGKPGFPISLPLGRGLGKAGFPILQPLLGAASTPHRQGDGETWFPHMFTSGPMRMAHNAAMNMGYLWEGRPLPGPPPLGEGTGLLPSGRGCGETRFPHTPTAVGGAWRPSRQGRGEPRVPYFHLSHPCGCAAQRHDEHGFFLGGRRGAAPPRLYAQTLRQGGGWGNPVSPLPNRCWERLAPYRQGCGSTGSPQVGKPGFPVCSPQSSMRLRRTTTR